MLSVFHRSTREMELDNDFDKLTSVLRRLLAQVKVCPYWNLYCWSHYLCSPLSASLLVLSVSFFICYLYCWSHYLCYLCLGEPELLAIPGTS